jgi:two-component system, LuxR family, sensor kinase FixL
VDSQDQAILAAIVDCSDDAILSKDLKGSILTWNKSAERLFGYRPREIVGKSITLLIPANRLAEEKMILGKLRRGKRVEHYETVRVHKDGREIDVSISVAPLRNSSGKVVGASKIIRDISDRNQTEAALRESEKRLRAILETAVDAIITIDQNGIIESANQATTRLFGYAASELIGQNVKILTPEPYRGEHDTYLRNYLRTGRARIIGIGREVTGLRKDGTTFPMNLSVSEVPVDGKRLFTGIVHDLTNRRQMERQIVEASAAEQRRIGQDLHDGLCQDLIGIAFQSDAVARQLQGSSPSDADEINKISAEVRRAASEARQLSHGLNPVDLHAGGLPAALEILTTKISDSFGVRCIFNWDQAAQAYDDVTATHLYRITQEAITNAIRHGKATRIDVDLRMSQGNLALSVKDNGAGLPETCDNGNGQQSGQYAGPSNVRAGIGIQGMYYRAHLIGGVFDLRRHERGGTVATCSIFKPPGVPTTKASLPTQRKTIKASSDKVPSAGRRVSR